MASTSGSRVDSHDGAINIAFGRTMITGRSQWVREAKGDIQDGKIWSWSGQGLGGKGGEAQVYADEETVTEQSLNDVESPNSA